MSYCVNCGVKLSNSQNSCPLCNTVVINPNVTPQDKENAVSFYPKESEVSLFMKNKKITILITSLIFFMPVIISFVVDYIYTNSLTWSMFVFGGVFTFWTIIVVPFMSSRPNPYLLLTMDTVVVLSFLSLVQDYTVKITQNDSWFVHLALPICFAVWLSIIIIIVLIKNKTINALKIVATAFFLLALVLIVCEIVIDLYTLKSIYLQWSTVCLTVLSCFSVLILFIDRKRNIKDSLVKKMHI